MKTLEERKDALYDKLERYDGVMCHLQRNGLETVENLNKFDEPFANGLFYKAYVFRTCLLEIPVKRTRH